ncbi:sialidase family protein [Jiangella alkaliphila]|uniref:BNR repeat-like domain-containing protein n=1 Tax=Jiangella alkaliphila TaxID=419479 RepID=A0A1H2LPX4_9ACTN|nr:sialidase family protein [Jiangella alkaliphila]SDU82815.1 BNR repeat-like domain-containing protein [Jiangella alkaliphila]
MRTVPVLLAGVVALGLLSTPASSAPDVVSGGPTWSPGTPDVVIAQAAPGKKLHFPNAERLADGSVVAVAREGAGHTGQDGRLLMLTSDDGGSTWSAPEVVHDSPYDDRDPMITQLSSGRLLLSWFQNDYSVTPPEPMGTFVAHSDDGGQTWSAPVAVQSMLSGESDIVDTYELGWNASHGQVKELPGGDLIVPLYGTVPDDKWQKATVVRSSDGGETWSAATESLIASATGTHYQEPVLTVLPGGVVHALLRIGTAASTMGAVHSQESWSRDGGRTWSAPAEIDLVTSSAHTEVLRDGSVFLAYGDLSGHFTDRRGTVGAVIRSPLSPWSGAARELVWDSGTGDQANPAVVEARPGRVLVIGFDSAASRLVGTFVDVSDVRPDRPDPRRVDLAALVASGAASVSTDMTHVQAGRPGVGVLGAIDGVVGYWDAAWAPRAAPASYTVEFDRPRRLSSVGVALKPGYASAAVVSVRSASGGWRDVGSLDSVVRWGDDLTWFRSAGPVDAVRVSITSSSGWAVLAELGVRAPGG